MQSKCGFIGYPTDESHIIMRILAVHDPIANYPLRNADGDFEANLNYFPVGLEAVKTKKQQYRENINGHKNILLTPISATPVPDPTSESPCSPALL